MRVCEICGSNKSVEAYHGQYLCSRHIHQLKKYGQVQGNIYRSKRDPNEIVIHDEYAEVVLYDKLNQERCRAFIDLDDVDKVKNFKWHLNNAGYAVTGKNDRVFLHHLVIGAPPKIEVDHRDLNTLNCRKYNLRPCTRSQNSCNTGLRVTNTTGVKNVWFNKREQKYVAQIVVNYKKISLGYYSTLDEAEKVISEARIKYHGEFAREA